MSVAPGLRVLEDLVGQGERATGWVNLAEAVAVAAFKELRDGDERFDRALASFGPDFIDGGPGRPGHDGPGTWAFEFARALFEARVVMGWAARETWPTEPAGIFGWLDAAIDHSGLTDLGLGADVDKWHRGGGADVLAAWLAERCPGVSVDEVPAVVLEQLGRAG